MPTTPPDAIAALFDLPSDSSSPPSADSNAETLEAEEAALAAELALAIDAGGVAADAPDSRTNLRLEVSWPARMHLPGGRVIDVKVRNVSASGVGLTSDEKIPASILVRFEMDVPRPGDPGKANLVEGTIKTAYAVAQGSEMLGGGTWQAPPDGLEFVNAWIRGGR